MAIQEHKRQLRQAKQLCGVCRERKARFRYRGEVRADRHHTLCFECHRCEVNRARARQMVSSATVPGPRSPFGRPPVVRALSEGQRAHRRRMLEHLQRVSVVASRLS